MLKRLKNLEDTFSVSKAAAIVGFFTLLIKFVAIYRERLFAGTFGQGPILDSYFAAFRVPDFLTNLLVLSTLSVAFLPIFTGMLSKDEQQAYRFANRVILIAAVVITFFCFVLLVFSKALVQKLVPGFTFGQFADTLSLTRLFLLSPIIFAMATIYGGILNAKKQFFITSFAPLLYNLGIICGVIFLYPRFGILGLGYGVIIGALAQLLLQILAAGKQSYVFSFEQNADNNDIKKLWRLYLPRIFSFDLSNITLILGTVVGSSLVAGSITALNQAYNLQAVPVGVFGYSLALAIFPVLSELYALGDIKKYTNALSKSISHTLYFIIPISVLTIIYGEFIVRLILQTGKFTPEDAHRTFQVLAIFSLSFFSQSLTTLLSRAFFARHNTKIPVIINIAAIAINILMGILLGQRYGVLGLASAFVIASIFNALALLTFLRNHLKGELLAQNETLTQLDVSVFETIWKVSFASIVMGLVCFGVLQAARPYVNTGTISGILLNCAVSGLAGLASFLGCSVILQIPETKKSLNFFRKIF